MRARWRSGGGRPWSTCIPPVVCSVLLATLTGGCRDVLGVDYSVAPGTGIIPRPPRDSGPEAAAQAAAEAGPGHFSSCGGTEYATATCQRCADQNCCAAAQACADDSVCAAWLRCRAACTDGGCIAGCTGRVPGAFRVTDPPADAYRYCLEQRCAGACQSYAIVEDAGTRACGACAAKQCIGTGEAGAAPATAQCYQGVCRVACAAPDWSCVGHVEWPVPNRPGPVALKLLALDFQTNQGIPGGTIRACRAEDWVCNRVLASATTRANGTADLTIDSLGPFAKGFLGYWDFTAPNYYPTLSFVFPPVAGPGGDGRAFNTRQTVQAMATFMGLDPSQLDVDSVVGVLATSCEGSPASGVVISSPDYPAARSVYSEGFTLTHTLSATSASGLGSLLPVKGGTPLTIEARRQETGELVSRVDVVTRPGWVTYMTLPPTPL